MPKRQNKGVIVRNSNTIKHTVASCIVSVFSTLIFLSPLTAAGATGQKTCKATLYESTIYYKAVGSVKPRVEAKIMAQASGQFLTLTGTEGIRVKEGDVLATIEDRQLSLALSQASNSVSEAEAGKRQAEYSKLGAMALFNQTRLEFERVKKMHSKSAATDQQLEQAEAAHKQAQSAVNSTKEAIKGSEAAVKRALDGVSEIKVSLGFTKVKAPFSGVIIRKFVDQGDLAWPGRPIYQLIKPDSMRMEAHIRESLAGKLALGQKLKVTIDAIDTSFTGIVEEIVPSADPLSRTFITKVSLNADKRLLPGMFARLEIPIKTKASVVIPDECIHQYGQLQMVNVFKDNKWNRRLIRTGQKTDKGRIILSGLAANELVATGNRGE